MEGQLRQAARQFPAVIVTGPRQSGKTTLLKHVFGATHRYVTLDNPGVRLLATREPGLFLGNYPPPVIIDEIQHAPGLLTYIKLLIDRDRQTTGRFILTGSQFFPLMAGVGETLAGRIAVLTLLGLSLGEAGQTAHLARLDELKRRIFTGSFPEFYNKKKLNHELWLASYVQTYLERDVRQLRQVGDLGDFQRFLQLAAALNGQVLNLSGLSRDLGVAVNTVKAWLAILEVSGQIVLLKPFYLNKGKRIIKSPKVYFLDSGMVCYLTGITSPEQMFRGPLSGQLFEGIVLAELLKHFYNHGQQPRIYWWRTSTGEEVDFIMEKQGRIVPVEVKLSANPNPGMIKGMDMFNRLFAEKTKEAWLVCLAEQQLPLDKKITAVPLVDFIGMIADNSF
jgi:predicted AAA+ superfamily ATPase